MESLQGPINSYFFAQKMSSECLEMGHSQMSFLQMLNGGPAQSEEEEQIAAEQLEDKKQLQFQIQQRFQRESHFRYLLRMQNSYNARTIQNSELKRRASSINVGPQAKKNRKRPRAPPPPTAKNPLEVESQRVNHIAVERNRRKLMNSHLNALRSLMPASFVQRSDQASMVAGAIDYVKKLEQLLLSLQTKKRIRMGSDATATSPSISSSCANDDDDACHVAAAPLGEFFVSPQYVSYSESRQGADVEATVVQDHVNLKVVGRRREGQLVRLVAALEEVGLSVLHLNVTSMDAYSILYSLNLKMEEECKLRSADEIATAVHQIFSYISLLAGSEV